VTYAVAQAAYAHRPVRHLAARAGHAITAGIGRRPRSI